MAADLPLPLAIRRIAELEDAQLEALAHLLIDCVHAGASVSFMQPLSLARALDFWQGVAKESATGARALLIAESEEGIVGTVQLVLSQPDNQPHRADLAKMLVHPQVRRRGLGAALMQAAERTAHECGKTLLVLDTASPDAGRLYTRLGWQRVGVIPGYALMPDGALCDTTYFYRMLEKKN